MWQELCRLRNRPPPVAYYNGGAWGYGEVYLTPFEQRASRFQSECISLIKSDIRYMRHSIRQDLLIKYPQVAECLVHDHRPIILRLSHVHQSMLMSWSTDDPLDETGDEKEVKNKQDNPHPTFRLRTPITAFEVIQSLIKPLIPKRRVKHLDDEIWPLSVADEWLLDFLRWAVIPSKSKANCFWKGYIEHTIGYVSNNDVSRAFRQLGYVFPGGYRSDDQTSQLVRWKWRSHAHKKFLHTISESNDSTNFGIISTEFEQIRTKSRLLR